VVFSGSHNLNYDANYRNDEILVKTFNDELYDDMLSEHFEKIWASGSPVTHTTPAYGEDDHPAVEATGGEMP
jgi:phosphatidylserine/phosphatidylglycerophosphate/cardiolipin synthase-like enzyme